MAAMGADSGLEPDHEPDLSEFVLARIAEDKRAATDANAQPGPAEHGRWHDPAHVIADCSARLRLVQVCREMGPDMAFLGARPRGMADFFLSPSNQHQLAALTLALLAVPYAGHHDYRSTWRP
jgi:hypothetical protein